MRFVVRKLRNKQLQTGVPIVIGEYSAVGWAPGAADWIKDATDMFLEYGWSSYFHSWGEDPVWDPRYDGDRNNWQRVQYTTDRMQMLINYFTATTE